MIIIDEAKKETIVKEKRILELKKLLQDSDWTQSLDLIERKGQDWVNVWKEKRKTWYLELKSLEI